MKKWIGISLVMLSVLVLARYVVAESKIELSINNWHTNITPKMIDGQLMIPLEDFAKEIGATVTWNGKNNVDVYVPQVTLQKRVTLLEQAIAPKTPEEAVRLWFEGIKNRNGAIQYAVLAPNLRTPKWLKAYEQFQWVLPGSSPWIESYTLSGKQMGEKSWEYVVDYILTDSTGLKTTAKLNLTVEQFSENWYVTKVPKGYGGVE